MSTKVLILAGIGWLVLGALSTAATLVAQVALIVYAALMGALVSGPHAAAGGIDPNAYTQVPGLLWQGVAVTAACLFGSTVCVGEATRRRVMGHAAGGWRPAARSVGASLGPGVGGAT
jgi:hypothetical protein